MNISRLYAATSYSPGPAGRTASPPARTSTPQSPSLSGHDFGRIGVDGGKKISAGTTAGDSPGTPGVKAITEGGTGRVNVDYAPEATDTSSKIVFIQVMREYVDDTPAKPSESNAAFAYQDADTTADHYHVDYVSGERDPYYNGDDALDKGIQGDTTSTPKVTAHMDDKPSYDDSTFPAGKSKLKYEFRSIAFSAAGADKGTYYGYAKWFFEKEKGKPETTKLDGTSTETALPKSKEAINLWCSNHSFTPPTP